MSKSLVLYGIIMLSVLTSFAQNSSVEYFEVFTKLAHPRPSSGFSFNRDSILARINNIPDTAGTLATFVISVSDPSVVDSLFFTLTDSRGQLIHSSAGKLSNLQSNPLFKQKDKTLYFTVGPYPYLRKFYASASFKRVTGQSSDVKTFLKN